MVNSRFRLCMPVKDVSSSSVNVDAMDIFTRGLVWIVTFIWGWVDYLRLVLKVVWSGNQLKIGVVEEKKVM